MGTLKLFLIIVFVISFSACKDNNPVKVSTDFNTDIQNIVNEAWNGFAQGKENLPGGIAMQILSGKGDYFVGTGELANADNNIHFRGASTTKSFTAAGIILLYQQKKISLNHVLTDTIPGTSITYIPDTEDFDIPFKNQITIKMLIQNKSGIWDIINQPVPNTVNAPYSGKQYHYWAMGEYGEDHQFTSAELTSIVAKHGLYQFEPGEKFKYSNTGFNLAGLIIERVSGLRYDQFMEQNFLTPNNMLNTSFPYLGTDRTLPEEHASSYYYLNGESEEVSTDNISMSVAEGNVITTPANLAYWIKQLITGNAGVEKNYVDFIMTDCQPTFESHQYYGTGLVYTPGIGFGHNGGHGGYFTVMRYDPELDFAVAMFINVWDFGTFELDMYEEIYMMYGIISDIKEVMYK